MMNQLKSLITAAMIVPMIAQGQENYASRNGEVSFFSATPLENISAVNHKAYTVFNATTGDVQLSLIVKAFEFEKALMQEHFNENYMESNTYPKVLFKGKVSGFTADALKKPGKYDITVDGDITMHGVTRKLTTKGTVTVEPTGGLTTSSEFIIKPEDFDIKIPSVVRGQIAEEIQVKVRIDYQKM